ncbi:MAG: BON domain-containing protein [Gammaproteobacteria bacterium]
MNIGGRNRIVAAIRSIGLPVALLCFGMAGGVLAEQIPPPAAQDVSQDTQQTLTQQTADPEARADSYRAQRERETKESGAIVRVPAERDYEPEPGQGGEYADNSELRDAWLDGKLEVAYALNRHLSAFNIDTRVENGIVSLTGEVDSEVDKELAGEVARNIEGIDGVRNDLTVQAQDAEAGDTRSAGAARAEDATGERTLAQRIDDVTMTATVKSQLLLDDQTEGLQIDVDTRDHVVTLSGNVESDAERRLAEQIAGSVDEVERVQNELQVGTATGRDRQ